MVSFLTRGRPSPIGVDIGSRSVKLLQFNAARSDLWESARWDLPPASGNAEARDAEVIEAIRRAREGRSFRGRDAVLSLGAGSLFVQNLRVAQTCDDELEKIVHFEAAGRLPFSAEEAEIRFLSADDVRQGDTVRREVILLACHKPVIQRLLAIAEATGLRPLAIDPEPLALLRCYVRQFRRDDDQQQRRMFVNVGASSTSIIVARGGDPLLVKYVDLGGRQMDEAVAKGLKMTLLDAAALRRHNGDRRADQRDPEIARSIAESIRPVVERLVQEVSLSVRYHSVTFRGQPLAQIVFTGGESHTGLLEWFAGRSDLPCELGNPLRSYAKAPMSGRIGQWDVAAGLALREVK
jgi:type IV pilus assembly protein PilM